MNNATKLEKLHNCILLILDEIDRICEKHNIPYFLDSGSALGAIRHKGFIPWDDDADIGMLRENFERFISVAPSELSDRFFLQTTDTDNEYRNFFAKIRLNGTYYPEKVNENKNIHQGIFVDIFPFDYISDKKQKAIRETKHSRFLIRLYLFVSRKTKDNNLIKRITKKVLSIFSVEFYKNLCLKHYKKHNKKPTNTLTCYAYRMNMNSILHFHASDLTTVHKTEFMDRSYNIMDGFDRYLRTMFNDYMKLPPENKRVVHLEADINFGNIEV